MLLFLAYTGGKIKTKGKVEGMEGRKEMTLFELLNKNVDEYEEAKREERRKREEERLKCIYEYLEREIILSSSSGAYRRRFYEGEKVDETSLCIKIEDVVSFVRENPRLEMDFYGNEVVEVIWRKGTPEFCDASREASKERTAQISKQIYENFAND